MPAQFPSAIPSIARVLPTDMMDAAGTEADVLHNKLADEVEAIAARLGVTNSVDPTSVESRLVDAALVANGSLQATVAALGGLIAAAAEKSDPHDADPLVIGDVSSGNVAKKVAWSGLKKMARAQARKPWRFRGKLLVSGDSTTGWVGQTGVSLSVVQKPAGGPIAYRTNSQSVLRIVTSTNTFRAATATVSTGPVTTPRVDFWVYLEDPTTIVNMTVFFATSDDFTNYYSKNITPRLFVGWQCFSVNLATAGVTGSPTYETITRFRLQIQSTSVAGTSILFDSAFISPSAVSKCALIWDDGQLAEYTHTMPLLNKYNLIGNFAVYDISQRIEQWRLMAHSGHRIVVHGTQNLSTFGTLQQAKDSITAAAAWVAALDGHGCDPDVYVWPNGVYMYTAGSMELPQFLEQQGFVGGFATGNNTISGEAGINPYILDRLEINASTVAATWLSALDAHLSIGLCFALCAHLTVDSGATGDSVNRQVLDDILSGIRARINAGSLECVSARDLILHITESDA